MSDRVLILFSTLSTTQVALTGFEACEVVGKRYATLISGIGLSDAYTAAALEAVGCVTHFGQVATPGSELLDCGLFGEHVKKFALPLPLKVSETWDDGHCREDGTGFYVELIVRPRKVASDGSDLPSLPWHDDKEKRAAAAIIISVAFETNPWATLSACVKKCTGGAPGRGVCP